MNVTHSQLQFELGGGDVRVCGWRTVSTMFVSVVLMTDDKVNTHTHTHTHQTCLMKMSEDKQKRGDGGKQTTAAVCLGTCCQYALRTDKMPE